MSTLATSSGTREILVGMGQIGVGTESQRLRAILGSCVGVTIYHAARKLAIMAHIVLPESAGRGGTPGKFADTAVPHMLDLARQEGLSLPGLTAKFAGGSNMFGGNGPLRIGEANIEAVKRALESLGLRVLGHDVGGTCGRRIDFECDTGRMTIQCVGQPARYL